MAYTYNDFLNAANGAGVMDRFSKDDLTVAQKNPEYGLSMVSLMKDIGSATTEEQRLLATEAANQLRKNYGVYGTGDTYAGSFGSQINDLMGQLNNYGSFNYGNETVYQQILNSIAGQQPFQYDPETDPSMSAYRKAYLREGERAGANALAQAAAANGGQTSSFAMQAAQQANNYYAGKLADMVPTLEQNAYQRYLNDFQSKLSSLGALQNDRAQAQEDWMNGYNILQNNLGNLQQQDATDYQRYLQQVEQQLQAQQYADQQAQQKYENALALYNLLGYATPEVAEILGLNSGKTNVGSGSNIPAGSPNPGVAAGSDTGAGMSTDQIKQIQRLLGLPEDGIWGNETAATAKAMWGSTTAEDAWNSYTAMDTNSKRNTDTSDFSVTNRTGDGWITVPGYSRITWAELAKKVERGEIVEKVNYENGTITYSAAKKSGSTTTKKNAAGNTSNKSTSTNTGTNTGGKVTNNRFDLIN